MSETLAAIAKDFAVSPVSVRGWLEGLQQPSPQTLLIAELRQQQALQKLSLSK